MTGRHRAVLFALMLCLSLGVGLIVLGLVSYSFPPLRLRQEGDSLIVYDAELGFVPRPNARTRRIEPADGDRPALAFDVYTDDRGARVNAPGQRSPGRVDILTVGCSFSWGYGFEGRDTFAAQVAERLGVTVSNFAMGSFGTVQSLGMLRRNRDLQPRLVVYGLIADHLRRNVTSCAPSLYPFCMDVAHVTWTEGRPIIAPPRTDGVSRHQLHVQSQNGMLDPVSWLTHGLDVARGRMLWYTAQSVATDVKRNETALAFLLKEMASVVSGMDAKLLIVYIPSDYASPSPALTRPIAQQNIAYLDLTDAFRRNREAGGPSAYLQGDGHPSVAGHRLIADGIVRAIENNRLLDR